MRGYIVDRGAPLPHLEHHHRRLRIKPPLKSQQRLRVLPASLTNHRSRDRAAIRHGRDSGAVGRQTSSSCAFGTGSPRSGTTATRSGTQSPGIDVRRYEDARGWLQRVERLPGPSRNESSQGFAARHAARPSSHPDRAGKGLGRRPAFVVARASSRRQRKSRSARKATRALDLETPRSPPSRHCA